MSLIPFQAVRLFLLLLAAATLIFTIFYFALAKKRRTRMCRDFEQVLRKEPDVAPLNPSNVSWTRSL